MTDHGADDSATGAPGRVAAAPPTVTRRAIRGASAVLLPITADGEVDRAGWRTHMARTIDAGLVPAVNMDTGFGPYLSAAQRADLLAEAVAMGGEVIAGVHLDDSPGDPLEVEALVDATVQVADTGALPILFPCFGIAAATDEQLVDVHRRIGANVDRFLAFELGPMFHPAGRLFSDEAFAEVLAVDAVVGAKHSSLRRDVEWSRIRARDRLRPDFALMTGNDLAIDLVVHGVDYLLGLSTFDPEAFAARDAAWATGDEARFWELNDLLQYLGQFAFRAPVPAYRHDAAMFLHLRGLLASDRTHDRSPQRPASDRDILADIATRLDELLDR
ncbi:MAG: dihydrodipicolinate synthase family protein [Microthrixaceae bacterium]